MKKPFGLHGLYEKYFRALRVKISSVCLDAVPSANTTHMIMM